MSAPPYIPLFVEDYIGATIDLSVEEHGAYFLLLMAAWKQDDCSLPDDDRKLARICRVGPRKWKQIRLVMLEFWTIENGRWTNNRLQKERLYVENRSKAAAENARKRWNDQRTEKPRNRSSGGISGGNAGADAGADAAGDAPHTLDNTVEPSGSTAADAAQADPPKPIDAVKVIFDSGVRLLARSGRNDPEARTIIGRWRKTFGDGAVLAALARCEREDDVSNPLEWITGALKSEARKAAGNGYGNHPPRDNRDGLTRAIDRRLGVGADGRAAGETG